MSIIRFLTRLIILPASLLISLIFIMMLWVFPESQLVFGLLVTSVLGLYLLSLPSVADALLHPLEQRYATHTAKTDTFPDMIFVLAAGFSKDTEASGLKRLSQTSLVRLAEGVRLLQCYPNAQLMVCQYRGHGGSVMLDAALELGVIPERVQSIDAGSSTKAEIRAVVDRIGQQSIMLVTSAIHMPRAMRISQNMGLQCTAAPTDFRMHPPTAKFHLRWMPHSNELVKSEAAIYEYLASRRNLS